MVHKTQQYQKRLLDRFVTPSKKRGTVSLFPDWDSDMSKNWGSVQRPVQWRVNNDNENTNIARDLFWQRTLNSLDEALY